MQNVRKAFEVLVKYPCFFIGLVSLLISLLVVTQFKSYHCDVFLKGGCGSIFSGCVGLDLGYSTETYHVSGLFCSSGISTEGLCSQTAIWPPNSVFERLGDVGFVENIIDREIIKNFWSLQVKNFCVINVNKPSNSETGLKTSLLKMVNLNLVESESKLFGAILFGENKSLRAQTYRDMVNSGVLHMCVFSGGNITIATQMIRRKWLRLPTLVFDGVRLGLLLIVLLVVGVNTVPVLKSTVVYLYNFAAVKFGRKPEQINALGLAMFVTNIFLPLECLSLSYQFSFIASFGIAFFSSYFVRFLKSHLLSSIIAAQVSILPLEIIRFGAVHPWSLVFNIMLGPVIALIFEIGFFVLFVASIIPQIAPILFFPISGLIKLALFLIALINELPFAEIIIK